MTPYESLLKKVTRWQCAMQAWAEHRDTQYATIREKNDAMRKCTTELAAAKAALMEVK